MSGTKNQHPDGYKSCLELKTRNLLDINNIQARKEIITLINEKFHVTVFWDSKINGFLKFEFIG